MTQPLKGIRVLELANVMAGPVCGRLLSDMGADVVKIEGPRHPDPTRFFAPEAEDGVSPAFAMLNRGKRGVTLDLKSSLGRGALARMLEQSDAVVENFRPGALDRLGLDAEGWSREFPRLVHCRITGYGCKGPMAGLPGLDLIAQSVTGIMGVTGEGPGRPPVKCGPPVTDIGAGVLAALGIVSALFARQETGRGMVVDASLYQAGVFQTFWQSAAQLATGRSPGPLGTAHPMTAPYECFMASDGWIAVGAFRQSIWERLGTAIKAPELVLDPRFETNEARMAHLDELRRELGKRFRRRTRAKWISVLTEHDVPAGPVSEISEMLEHPQTRALGMIQDIPAPGGALRTLGMPLHFDGESARPARGAPRAGEHNREALASFGFSPAEASALEESAARDIREDGRAPEVSDSDDTRGESSRA